MTQMGMKLAKDLISILHIVKAGTNQEGGGISGELGGEDTCAWIFPFSTITTTTTNTYAWTVAARQRGCRYNSAKRD